MTTLRHNLSIINVCGFLKNILQRRREFIYTRSLFISVLYYFILVFN